MSWLSLIAVVTLAAVGVAADGFVYGPTNVCLYDYGRYDGELTDFNFRCSTSSPCCIPYAFSCAHTANFPFMGQPSRCLFLSSNGVVWFREEILEIPLVPDLSPCVADIYEDVFAPEHENADARMGAYVIGSHNGHGSIFGHVPLAADDMFPLLADIDYAFGIQFDVQWAIQLTWQGVNNVDVYPGGTVTYQMALMTDFTSTYVIYKYGYLGVQNGSMGFRYGDNSFELPLSDEVGSQGIQAMSNCNVPGIFVFKVDGATIEQPTGSCSGFCSGYNAPVVANECTRCGDEADEAGKCNFFGYCFEPNTLLANMDCTLGCKCGADGNFEGCKPLKKDKDPRVAACNACKAASEDGAPCASDPMDVVFVDSEYCRFDCLAASGKLSCGEAGKSCADLPADVLLNKKFIKKGGVINWCDVAGM